VPLYEYKCNVCEQVSEILHKISDPTPEECPACGKSGDLIKILSPSAFHLKGGGWYADAYSSSKPKDSSEKSTSSDSPSPSKEASSKKAGSPDSSSPTTPTKPSSSKN